MHTETGSDDVTGACVPRAVVADRIVTAALVLPEKKKRSAKSLGSFASVVNSSVVKTKSKRKRAISKPRNTTVKVVKTRKLKSTKQLREEQKQQIIETSAKASGAATQNSTHKSKRDLLLI